MLIVFGTYSFALKKYTSDELGISTESGTPINIEIRQKVMHIFYIPLLPIGKVYAMRIDDKLYNLPAEHHAAVDARGGIGTPWYSFALPILLLAIGAFVWGKSAISKYQHDVESKKKFEAGVAAVDSQLVHLSTHDYIELENIQNRYGSQAVYLRVLGIKDANVICAVMHSDLYADIAKPYEVDAEYREQQKLDTVILSRTMVEKACVRDYDLFDKGRGVDVQLLHDGVSYRITRILDADAPAIYVDDQFESGGHNVVLKNFGQPVILSKMKNLKGSPEWVDTLPIVFDVSREYDQEVLLQSSNYTSKDSFKTLLVFDDTLGNSYRFKIDGMQRKAYATRIY
jgi:hypothetical protein